MVDLDEPRTLVDWVDGVDLSFEFESAECGPDSSTINGVDLEIKLARDARAVAVAPNREPTGAECAEVTKADARRELPFETDGVYCIDISSDYDVVEGRRRIARLKVENIQGDEVDVLISAWDVADR
jgi:hypothetical protein